MPVAGAPLRRPVSIRWDDHAVPFVRAENDGDLATALGVVHAHLRGAQIEALRRIAAGRVAETVGPLGVPVDRAIRALELGRAARRIADGLPDGSRAWLGAFLRGLDHGNAHCPRPPELRWLGVTPSPWTIEEFFVLARLYSADLTWPVLRRLLALRERTAPARWRALWPAVLAGGFPDPALARGADAALLGRATRAGSNAAALAAERSASGAALLGGDPHLANGLPDAWLIAALSAPETETVGLMLPGIPFVACGRNRDIAWGGTALHAASSEFVDVSSLPPHAFASVTEAIAVRGGRTRRVARRRTAHGPVVSDAPLFPARRPIALRWVGHAPTDELTAMLGVMRARDADGFRAALAGFAVPGQTMVYAGPDGVGRQVAAHLPRRGTAVPDDLVVAPDRAARDWDAVATGPSLYGEWVPAAGFVASANERLPARDDRDGNEARRPVPIGRFFAPDGRVSRLRALLDRSADARPFDLARFAAVFRDERQPDLLPVRDRLVRHLPARRPARREGIVTALRGWTGGYEACSEGALAFELLFAGTARALLPRGARRAVASIAASRPAVIDAIGRADAGALAGAVARALPGAARRFRRFGRWGAVHRHRPQHPFGGVPLLGRRFRQPPFPGSGGNDTLNKSGHGPVRRRHVVRFGGTARYAFDLADPDRNALVLFGGQDGWPGSDNAADQIALWRRGETIDVPLRPATAARDFLHETVLRPAGAAR